MSNVKNFGLIAVGSQLQFGKSGPKLINTAGRFDFTTVDGVTPAPISTGAITSASGNVTLTTGNLVLTSNTGTLSIGGDSTISRQAAGVLKFNGTGSVIAPVGTTAERPASVTGSFRYNTTVGALEYYGASSWLSVANTTETGNIQTELNAVETALGPGYNIATNLFNPAAFTDSAAGSTDFTDAINQVAAAAAAHDTLDEILPGTAGQVIYNNAGTWAAGAKGSVSGVQAWDAGLDNLAALSGTGLVAETADGVFANRTIVAPAAGITITNPGGVAGNITFALSDDLAGIEAITGTGYSVRTAANTWATRSIVGTAGRITVSDGAGASGNTGIDLATVTQGASGSFLKFAVDGYGRVTDNTPVTTSDITTLVNSQYLRLDGTSSMAGDLAMGNHKITGLLDPTTSQEAATKNYVDNAVTGLSWKHAVITLSSVNVVIASPGTFVIGGATVTTGSRILLINQTDPYENGIYVFDTDTTPMVRSSDADVYTELNGAAVFVQEGTSADSGWTQTTTLTSLTSGPTQVWTQFSGAGSYTNGPGIDITGNVISAKLGAGISDLPTGEIGIDVQSGVAVQLTGNTSGSQLTFVLDGVGITSGLTQSSAGLKIASGGVTNAQLANSSITFAGNTGFDAVALGETLTVSSADSAITVTAGTNSLSLQLNTVDVAHGGTGLTTLTAGQILVGNGTSAVSQSSALSFDSGTSTLTVGTSTLRADTANVTLTATGTNGDINLVPNGTGSVVVGTSGAALIEAEAAQSMTLVGNNTLVLSSTSGDIVMTLTNSTVDKVTVAGPSAVDYATGLASGDLVNKYYVDQTVAAGAGPGTVKTVNATITTSVAGTYNIGAILPAGSAILSVKVNVTSPDTGTATLEVGKAGLTSAYMTPSENDIQSNGIYLAETYVAEGSAVQVIATVVGSVGTGGSADVIVEYQLG